MKIDIIQLEFIDPKLRRILTWLERQTGLTFTVTSIYRIGDLGVHGTLPVRGIDLSCHNILIGTEIQNSINRYWEYDYKRPSKNCARLHGKTLHLHVQVHPNTRLKI